MKATVFGTYGGKKKRVLSISYNVTTRKVECDNWFRWGSITGNDYEIGHLFGGAQFTPDDGLLYVILLPLIGPGAFSSAIAIEPDDELNPLVCEADALIMHAWLQPACASRRAPRDGALRDLLVRWAAWLEIPGRHQ